MHLSLSKSVVTGIKEHEFKGEEPPGATLVMNQEKVQDTKVSKLLKEAKPVIKVSHQGSKNESYMLTEVPRKEPDHKLSHEPPPKCKPKIELSVVQKPRIKVSFSDLKTSKTLDYPGCKEETFKEIPPDNLLLIGESTLMETRNVATKTLKDHPHQKRCNVQNHRRGVILSHLLKEEPQDAPCITKPKLYQDQARHQYLSSTQEDPRKIPGKLSYPLKPSSTERLFPLYLICLNLRCESVAAFMLMPVSHPTNVWIGPNASMLVELKSIFIKSVKVVVVIVVWLHLFVFVPSCVVLINVFFFYASPPVAVMNWSESRLVYVSHRSYGSQGWPYYLNKGALLNISYNVKPEGSSVRLVVNKGLVVCFLLVALELYKRFERAGEDRHHMMLIVKTLVAMKVKQAMELKLAVQFVLMQNAIAFSSHVAIASLVISAEQNKITEAVPNFPICRKKIKKVKQIYSV
uniref:E3 ubiquitin-protein ligase APD1-4 N-terminal domain-containing protein n=1 Tax=Brassica oleracea var. oleracea TaxID=109376 RepID=A0A0D3BQZ5_BRAOL